MARAAHSEDVSSKITFLPTWTPLSKELTLMTAIILDPSDETKTITEAPGVSFKSM